MAGNTILVWSLVANLIITATVAAIRNTLSYSIMENTARDHLVANIAVDSGLKDEYALLIYNSLTLSFVDEAQESEISFKVKDGKELVTAEKIDRDSLCTSQSDCVVEIDLQVQPLEYFQIIKVSIRINDTNDNSPMFPDLSVIRVISETSAPGYAIPVPMALDADSPEFGIKRYSLVDLSGNFDLVTTATSGQIQDISLALEGKLDYEEKQSYEVEILAHDSGNNTGRMKVNIQVQDVNDNPPIFTNQSYEFFVLENSPRSVVAGQVLATDADTGTYGVVKYGFPSTSDPDSVLPFQINSTTGSITVRGDLDREKKASYTLSVTAQNEDPNSLPTTAKVIINILDINDNAPVAKIRGSSDDRTVSISESLSPGSFVAHITVLDPDLGENGTFNCISSNDHFDLAKLFETEYKLSTKLKLDRETVSQYGVEITCTDKGNPVKKSTKLVTVVLLDENDNPPRFVQSVYSTSVLENNKVGKFLVKVQASDPDEGVNSQVKYRFSKISDFTKMLSLDPISGNITANASFDHENITNNRLQVEVEAYDLGKPSKASSAQVIIDVVDEDDEQPVFEKSVYELGVYENEPMQTEVGTVVAVDRDSSLFNKFIYQIDYTKADADAFTINSETGQIFTSRTLDRETKSTYNFTVRAISSGLHPKSSASFVSIYVADKNDNSPSIIYPNFKNNTVHISNKHPKEGLVSTVIAEDPDANMNARLSYQIITGNSQGYFGIGEFNGVVYLEKDVHDIEHQLFGLVIAVTDQGEPPRTSEAFLNVIVNRSIASSSSGLMSNQNLTIVIAIATVSGLLMVTLLVSIAVILRWPKLTACLRDSNTGKYNHHARIIDIQNAKQGPEAGNQGNQDVTSSSTGIKPGSDLSYVNLSFQDETKDKLHKQLLPMKQDKNFSNGHNHPPGGQGQVSRPHGLPPRDYPQSSSQNSSHHSSKKPPAPPPHSDTDSTCSADLSNVTDSGRGSNGSNDDPGFQESISTPSKVQFRVQDRHRQRVAPQNQPLQSPNRLQTKHLTPGLHPNSGRSSGEGSSQSHNYHNNALPSNHISRAQGMKKLESAAISQEVHV